MPDGFWAVFSTRRSEKRTAGRRLDAAVPFGRGGLAGELDARAYSRAVAAPPGGGPGSRAPVGARGIP